MGVIALLDERFLQRDNRRLFPREWEDYRTVDLEHVDGLLADFWQTKGCNL